VYTTDFKTSFACDRLQSSWSTFSAKKGSQRASARFRALFTSGLAHKLFARSRFKIGFETSFKYYKGMAGLLLCGLFLLGGCAASNHPMTKMIRMQGDMMQELADVLRGVDDVSDLEAATKQIENLTGQMQGRMGQFTKSMDMDTMPTSKAEAKRLQSAMQREMKKLRPVMKQIQNEMERLSKLDWAGPLLEAAEKYEYEFEVKS